MPLSRLRFVRGMAAGLMPADRPWLDWPLPVVWAPAKRAPTARARHSTQRARRHQRHVGWLAAAVVAALGATAFEVRTSALQSWAFAQLAERITYHLEPGPSPSIRFPTHGPTDARLGYTRLPHVVTRLESQGFEVVGQARWSPLGVAAADAGLYVPYDPKPQTGLVVADRAGRPMHEGRFPRRVFTRFDEIPSVVVLSLLFVENRELLAREEGNPAIEYPRLARAVLDLGLRRLDPTHAVSGGSTLATQLEKVRHSPGGRTGDVAEKGRQMASASLRAFRDGLPTRATRERIVVEYLNSLPLGAVAGLGEVVGFGDGLWAWFDADPDEVVRTLRAVGRADGALADVGQAAVAYRQALSLLLAARRPTAYLVEASSALDERVDSYLRLLAAEGVISPSLRDAALEVRLDPRRRIAPTPPAFADRKGADGARVELLSRLGLPSIYLLDRLDLTATTSLDAEVTDAVAAGLGRLGDPTHAREAGLVTWRLLGSAPAGGVTYSLTLYERGPFGNHLRVQADTFDGPLNINEGTRLELGSTAKLRTLVTYLEVVATLHRDLASLPDEALAATPVHPRDRLTRWAVDYLARTPDRDLGAMLEAATRRTYSASPGETFFTGGGVHRFGNFDAADNTRVTTVREAFERSVNLVFVRLMRDIVWFHVARSPDAAGVLEDATHPQRAAYLARFADREGLDFLRRFHAIHRDDTSVGRLSRLVTARPVTPTRLAVIFRTVRPEAGADEFADFLAQSSAGRGLSAALRAALFAQYSPDRWTLQDLGYLARVHPLELWLVAYLETHPTASWAEVVEASADARQESYQWLFRTGNRRAQDRAIHTVVEADAFERIHESWVRLGYPFTSLVPSYATAIGSSGDNPAALSELLGIVVNDGLRLPRVRLERLHFAEGTPYETLMGRRRPHAERVLVPEVAALLRQELLGVVQRGTGRRMAAGVVLGDGTVLPVGGKTGTGDNRFEAVTATGRSERVVNRTAAFAFTVGDRFFGTIVAFVPGPEAARYEFTSALPVQVFKTLLPLLEPVFVAEPEPTVMVATPQKASHPPAPRIEPRLEAVAPTWDGLGERRDPIDVRRRDFTLGQLQRPATRR